MQECPLSRTALLFKYLNDYTDESVSIELGGNAMLNVKAQPKDQSGVTLVSGQIPVGDAVLT